MGQTTSTPPGPPLNQRGQADPKPEGKGQGHDKKDGEKEGNPPPQTDLVYDETLKKYFDPISGSIVATPGRFDPEPEKRPLRVKVRKRQHYKLRKRRRKPKPIVKTPSPQPPKAIRPQTKYDPDGYAMYYDEFGNRMEYDEDGHLVAPEPYEDEDGYLIEPQYDDFGNLLVYDHFGIMVGNDDNGDPMEYDRYGYPIQYDEDGQPVERTFYPRYDEFGNEIPPPKKPEITHPDDGYDYDDSIYTYTTLESPPLPTPSPVSSDDVQDKDDSGDDLSMEDVYDFHWRPYQPVMPKEEARALIKIGGEDCNCFPRRSDPLIPSMVYDRIECRHSNHVIGHAHTGVVRFDDNWNDRFTRVHRPKRQERHRSKVAQVWGYPNKQFPYQEGGGALFEGGLRGEFQKTPASRTSKTQKTPEKGDEKEGDKKPSTPKATKSAAKKDNKSDKKESEDKKAKADKKDEKKDQKNDKKETDKISKADNKDDDKKEDAKAASRSGSKKDDKKDDVKKDNQKNAAPDKKSSQSQKDKKADNNNKENKKEEEVKENEKDKGKEKEQEKEKVKEDAKRPLNRARMNQGPGRQGDQGKQPNKNDKERPGNRSRASYIAKSYLPRIGYTPDQPFSNGATPANNARSPEPLTNRVETPLLLPPIPASPSLTMYSGRSASQDFYSVHADIPTSRKFEGKYYDPVTKKTYTYDIKPKFGKNIQEWDALRQV